MSSLHEQVMGAAGFVRVAVFELEVVAIVAVVRLEEAASKVEH